MQGVQQIVSGAQLASSATNVAGAMAKAKAAATTTGTGSTGSTATTGSAASASSASAADSSTITANDFLTLLVAEMKNQDPTQPTDPNEYISQMVDVNSLQQLIGINQGITSLDTAAGATTSGATPSVSGTNPTQ